MKGFLLKKSLIGQQDLLLGRQSETQERGNALVNVDGIQMIYPVRTLADLKQLDPTEYETAFLFGENTLDVLDPEFGGLDADINELYYFDFTSNEDELLPNVIKSNIREYGRWKLSKLGEKRLYRIAVPLLTELAEEKKDEITTTLREEFTELAEEKKDEIIATLREDFEATMDEQIAISSAETLSAAEKRGLLYNHDLVYKTGHFTRVLVDTQTGLQEKTFLRQTNDAAKAPLPEVARKVGDTNIYKDTPVSEGWENVVAYQPTTNKDSTTSLTLDEVGYVRIFQADENPKGQIDITFKGIGDSIVGCATIEFFGMGTKYFKIKEAIYSDIIQNKGLTNGSYSQDERLIYLPTFAIAADETSFGIHFGSLTYAQGLEIDFSRCTVAPNLVLAETIPAKKFAIRPNGGSEIPNLGELTYFNFTTTYETNLDMYQSFTTGKLRWTTSLELDPYIYHQYNVQGKNLASLKLNVGGVYLQNSGVYFASAGKYYAPELPNIKGQYGSEGSTGRTCDGGGCWSAYGGAYKATGAITDKDGGHVGTNSSFHSSAGIYFNFDASRYNPTYADGGGVRPHTYCSVLTIQVF